MATKTIYTALIETSAALDKAITLSEDFPPFYFDGNNAQLTADLEKAKLLIENARDQIATGSVLGETTEPVYEWNITQYSRNGGTLKDDIQPEDLQSHYYYGLYKDGLKRIIDRSIHPNQITYFIQADNNVVWEGCNIETANSILNQYQNGDEQYDTENDEPVEYTLTSAVMEVYHNGLLIDFDDLLNRAVDYAFTNEPDYIYGNVDKFLLRVRDMVKAFDDQDATDRIKGVHKNNITIRLHC